MIILGIDPGTAICGYGIINYSEGNLNALHYGAITTNSKARMLANPNMVRGKGGRRKKTEKEEVKVNNTTKVDKQINSTTAIPVGQARGIVLLAAVKNHVEIIERTPNEIKQSVTGYGGAAKEQVIYMVTKLLHLSKEPKPDDVADALAVAICAAHTSDTFAQRNII